MTSCERTRSLHGFGPDYLVNPSSCTGGRLSTATVTAPLGCWNRDTLVFKGAGEWPKKPAHLAHAWRPRLACRDSRFAAASPQTCPDSAASQGVHRVMLRSTFGAHCTPSRPAESVERWSRSTRPCSATRTMAPRRSRSIHVTGGTSRIQDLASARAATRLGWLRAELRARCAYPRPRGADPERTPICIWVSSTGFRQPGLLCAFRRRLVTVHVSPVSPSLTKEGNAACARQVCRKVTTRETRDQRRISTWYQNLRVLSAQSSGRSPEG